MGLNGPSGTTSITGTIGWLNTDTTQKSGIRQGYQSSPLKRKEEGLTWEKKLATFDDAKGTRYPPSSTGLQRIPKLPEFATGCDRLEVQGTWSFPKDFSGDINLQIEVQQDLAYAALIKNVVLTPKFKVFPDKQGDVFEETVKLAVDALDGQSSSAKLPFTFGKK
jgi:hypothetical protein